MGILLALVCAGYALVLFSLLSNREDRAAFGDMFGAINALFAGLALGGVIYTIILQQRELALQRRELKLTRRELLGQKEQMEHQNETLRLQAFENKFFQLLGRFQAVVESTSTVDYYRDDSDFLRSGPKQAIEIRGRQIMTLLYTEFKRMAQESGKFVKDARQLKRAIDEVYTEFYRSAGDILGNYFRLLYTIIKFVDRSDVPDKRFYTNIVRAHLSNSELHLLFYNCLSRFGELKFKPLVERYELLQNMPPSGLVGSWHVELYAHAFPQDERST